MEGLGWLKDSFLSWTPLESSPVSGCSVATLLDLDILVDLGLSVAGLDFRLILAVSVWRE